MPAAKAKKVTKATTKTASKTPASKTPANKAVKNAKAKPQKAPASVSARAAKPEKKQSKGFISTKQIVALPKGHKPADKEEYMNKYQLEYFRRKLLDWKKELLDESRETLDHLKEENWNEPDINDRATVETDAALELRTRDRYRKLIGKIDSALRRIETGDYGYCEETGEPIGVKRLEARPTATLTIEAQQRHEKFERMYNDED